MLYSKVPSELFVPSFKIVTNATLDKIISLQCLTNLRFCFHFKLWTIKSLSNIKGDVLLNFSQFKFFKFILWQSTDLFITSKVQLCFHIGILAPFDDANTSWVSLLHMLRDECLQPMCRMRIPIQSMFCCKFYIWYQFFNG